MFLLDFFEWLTLKRKGRIICSICVLLADAALVGGIIFATVEEGIIWGLFSLLGLGAIIGWITKWLIDVFIETKFPKCNKLSAMDFVDRDSTDDIHHYTTTETVKEKVGSVTIYAGLDSYHSDIYRDKEVERHHTYYEVTNRYRCAFCGHEITKKETAL